MPYNVIILTSTVMALAFGSVFNMVVRRFVGRHEVPKKVLVEAIKKAVRGLMTRLRTGAQAGGKAKTE